MSSELARNVDVTTQDSSSEMDSTYARNWFNNNRAAIAEKLTNILSTSTGFAGANLQMLDVVFNTLSEGQTNSVSLTNNLTHQNEEMAP